MSTRIRFRRSTAAVWTSTNPILTGGELGYETDTGKFKIGDNATAWASLAYAVRAQLSEGYLNDLADVTITSPSNGQVLKWNGTAWINGTDSAGTTVNALDDIADVTITSAASGDILKWNGSAWVNDNALLAAKAPLASPTFTGTVTLPDNTVALGTKTTGDYVSSLVAGTGVTLSNNSGETATPTIAIGQAVATNSNVTFNDLTVAGNLTVSGTTTSVNTETLTVDDNIVVLNNNVTATPTENAGLEIERGTSANVVLRWNETTDKWETTNDGSTYSVIATNGNIALGTDTTGSYVTSLVAGTGVTLSNNSGEGATPTVTVDTSVIQARVTNVTDTEIGYLDGVTSAIQTQIDTKAPLASPALTGTPTAPTAAANTNTTQVATTAFVTTAVSGATISSLDDISDVTITSNSSGQFLKWNGSAWVNDAIDLGTDTTGSYVTSLVAGTGVTLTNNSGEGATPTIAIGQAVGTGSNVTFNDLTVSGNLTVSGTTTSINTEILTVDDNIIVLNNNVTASPTENSGIEIERGTSANVSLRWNETTDKWEFTNDGSTYNNLGAGGATISTTAPASPQEGAMWFDSDTAQTFVYYDSQWIEIGASGMAAMVSDTAPSAPIAGQIWFNSLNGGTYVYYSSAWTEVGAVPINALLNTINAKGDLLAGTADNTVGRLGVGTNGYFLKADSAETTGLVWAAIPSVSILDDVGDVTITSAASGQVLQWNGSAWINATVSSDVMTDSKNAALIIMDIGA